MAKKMSVTTDFIPYPESVWFPVFLAIDHPARQGRCLFYGYPSVTALAAGTRTTVGQQEYTFTGAGYDAITRMPVGRLLVRLLTGAAGQVQDPVLALLEQNPEATAEEQSAAVAAALDGVGLPAPVAQALAGPVSMLAVLAEAMYLVADTTDVRLPDGTTGKRFAGATDVTLPGQ